MRKVLLHIPDLFFGTRVADTLKQLGYEPRDLNWRAEPSAQLSGAALLVVQLSGSREMWVKLIEAARAADVPVLAFGAHVDAETLRAARQAGANKAVPNSQLAEELPQLVSLLVKP